MEKTPTAEEFLQQRDCIRNVEDFYNDVQPIDLIEFAKLHVEAALKKATIVLARNADGDYVEHPTQERILNSYPLDKIK
jgi:hypothetical protein